MEEDDTRKSANLSQFPSLRQEVATSSPPDSRVTSSADDSVVPDLVSDSTFAGHEDHHPSLGGRIKGLNSSTATNTEQMDATTIEESHPSSAFDGDEAVLESAEDFTSVIPSSSSEVSFSEGAEQSYPTSLSVPFSGTLAFPPGSPCLTLPQLESSAEEAHALFQPLGSTIQSSSLASCNDGDCSLGHQEQPSMSSNSVLKLDLEGTNSSPFNSIPRETASGIPCLRAFEQVPSPVTPRSRSFQLESPRRPRSQPIMPDVPPVLARLLDSAISGDANSLEDLRCIVSKERGDSRSVVDALLATMGGIDGFDESRGRNSGDPPSIMFSSQAALVAAKLIPWLSCEGDSNISESPRSRMVWGLLAILDACTRNRQCAQTALLAGHSVTVSDLNQWLSLVKKTINTEWASLLMCTLERAMHSEEMRGPACSFEFDGESSGLLGPGESRWPFSNGFSFVTWIYIESFADTLNTAAAAAAIAAAAAARSGKSSAMSAAAAATALAGEGTTHMPRLFSFISSDNLGFEAYFHGQFLVVESGVGKGRKASLHFTYAFKPKCWYFVGLEHTCKQGLMGKTESELRLYVDGHMYESRPFELPRISKSLAFSCIGTNPPPTMAGLQQRRRQCPLFAEMGPIYIFREPIGPEIMTRLASRGGDVLPCFGIGAGAPCLGTNDHINSLAEQSSILDISIEGSLHLLYHPSLLSGRFCPDASPTGAAGIHRRPSEVLGQVHVATRIRPFDSLWALAYGGPLSLLPLAVSQVKMDSLEPILSDFSECFGPASISVSIFRIITIAIQHPGNNEELSHSWAPEILSKILYHLLQYISVMEVRKKKLLYDEELLSAVISLCQSVKNNHSLRVQLFSMLLLDLKAWSLCKYGLQKKLLSSLADMVFSESSAMRDANALQLLLDGCRKCYWVIRELDSFDPFPTNSGTRSFSEVNLLVDELMVVVELLIGAAPSSFATADMRCLISYLIECPQPNQREAKIEDEYKFPENLSLTNIGDVHEKVLSADIAIVRSEEDVPNAVSDFDQQESSMQEIKSPKDPFHLELSNSDFVYSIAQDTGVACISQNEIAISTGSNNLPVNSKNTIMNGLHNIDNHDRIVVGIIKLLGALVSSGHLKVQQSSTFLILPGKIPSGEEINSISEEKVSLLLFAIHKALQAAPHRLMTTTVYTSLLCAAINNSLSDVGLKLYDSSHRFEHVQLLLVLLRSLPFASRAFQVRALQDLLFLACSNPENRNCLIFMEEWPEWILEVLIANYEVEPIKRSNDLSIDEIEDLIHNFLIIMLEHSMRQKNGWMEVEAVIHCADWLAMVGGSSTGDQRIRREKSLPIFKRRLLGGLLDFAVRELQVQTQVIAAAAAGVAAEGLPPEKAREEAEKVAHPSVALAENAIVVLMIVEDHLRSQAQASYCSTSAVSRTNSGVKLGGSMSSLPLSRTNSGGLPLEVLASMADENGQISAAVMERLTAAAAAEPYDSVRCAFISYGSCYWDLAEGWKHRSRLWYGVGLPSKADIFGGGGSGWSSWKSALELDSNGKWVDLPLIKKSAAMLQALLLDESGLGGSLGIGGGLGTGMGGMAALYQLLDSDQPFLCMLRIVLTLLREEDHDDDNTNLENITIFEDSSKVNDNGNHVSLGRKNTKYSSRIHCSALLWSVLAPILNMPIAESKRQRVLVAACILYAEVWHAVSKDRKILRKQYVEAILPPYITILRRWRPLLAGIPEFTSPDGLNPLFIDDHAWSADRMPTEVALYMTSPGWAAAFASPPAAMALAMVAAGVGGEATKPVKPSTLHHDPSFLDRKPVSLNTFLSLPKPPDIPNKSPAPKDSAAARAAAMAAERDRERFARVGSGKGLSAVAMATSTQRRNETDLERAKRWNSIEAMGTAWICCSQSSLRKQTLRKDYSTLQNKYSNILLESLASVENIQHMEMSRRCQVQALDQLRSFMASQAWRKFIHCLFEMDRLFGPFSDSLSRQHVFWKLDSMEGSSRMRRCLKRDYYGSDHLGAAAEYKDCVSQPKCDETSTLCSTNKNEASFATDLPSTASIIMAEAISMDEGNENEHLEDGIFDSMADDQQNFLEAAEKSSNNAKIAAVSLDQDEFHSKFVVAPGHAPSDYDEKLLLELSSVMVRPLKIVRGTFQVTTKRINFLIHRRSNCNPAAPNGQNDKDHGWLISSLHQMYSRRYLLRRSALELFMVDRSNFFFDFGSIDARKDAYRAIVQAQPPHLNNIYLATQRPDQLFKRTQLMERWVRWEVSNFEYLMELNTMAGRSYNDITQYPVFPWILADYTSKTLDLNNPSSYRDLSKPIGALNPERLKKFQERYSTFEDPVIPKFHYGSHYSTVGTVLYYLVRMEPFTTLSIQLQGGNFDHADRMFSDIAGTWKGVLEDMSDLKELVPEMFYLPEILTNENSINFGTTQLGEKIDFVKLPAWAENPVDFIHKHRLALESEYVSAHLHDWIDLIFGYKQRGKEAVQADNMFFYITYEGAVDIDKIVDPLQQRATQDQIAYFGQTPSQLLTIPHLKKRPSKDVLHLQTIFRNPNEVRPYVVPNPDRINVPASSIYASQDSVIVVDTNAPAARVAMHKWQPNTPDGQGTPFLFQHGKTAASSTGGVFMRLFRSPMASASEEWQFLRALAFAASGIQSSAIVAITCDKEIITGGHADNSIKVITADGAKTIETAWGHNAPVTCLSLSPDNSYLVTGSRDATVLLWKIHRMNPLPSNIASDPSSTASKTPAIPQENRNSPTGTGEKNRKCRIEGPVHVLRGHLGEIISCSVSSALGIVASCSYSSYILLHSLRTGRLMRKLVVRDVDLVCLSSQGVVVTWNKSEKMLRTFTVNGIPIASTVLSPFLGDIHCITVSADGDHALIGTSCENQQNFKRVFQLANSTPKEKTKRRVPIPAPSICFLNLHTLEVFHILKLFDGQYVTAFMS
ncbi:hypothetical protein HPP92_002990 [Vanilla planifolia]|uniref:Uncharacterized protein n=1 Tax=Vanilla planifolia TaxID=51239 RepID=A0A835S5D3_VANPL|nr:hypothetical protein HPP92_002990 [Vanilla planifolia]